MFGFHVRIGHALVLLPLVLGACDNFEMPQFLTPKDTGATSEPVAVSGDTTVKLVERDVEAPDVFQVTDQALWDGRPSLGGVWVAYPGNTQPERVIIRNQTNNKFVIGALFKRERENPGPSIQLSSDAAAALGVLAGKPTTLNVTALRREQVPDAPAPVAEDDSSDTPKDEPVNALAAAAAAIDAAEKAKAKPTPPPVRTASGALDKPFIQIGIFSVEQNARNTATSLKTLGIIPIIKAQESKGKKFWRVLAGPASNKSERSQLLKKVRTLGFNDAYFVTN